ncbi:outer membrane protein assembly factor BamA [Cytophagaceae bacterium ABcell3]|nr:outer membrane protein assembly factor BamA [Cytophagaceae bacterium ABcell3]
MRQILSITLILGFFFSFYSSDAQIRFNKRKSNKDLNLSYTNPEEYAIGEITFSGIEYLDHNALMSIIGLREGDVIQVPGEELSNAIRKLWDQKLIGDVEVNATRIEGNKIFLNFHLKERPRLSRIEITGVKKADHDDLKEKMGLRTGAIVTDAMIKNSRRKVRNFYVEKGYFNADVNIVQKKDSLLPNNVVLTVNVDRKQRVKINSINFHGNVSDPDQLSDRKLRRQMKKTKERNLRNIFSSSKLIKNEYEADKERIIEYYNTLGYRDAQIVSDSIYLVEENRLNIDINIEEGNKYYFRNITWTGNFIHPSSVLDTILNIRKGDVYNFQKLQRRLSYNPDGWDVSSLYLDDGYLFFHAEPVEVRVENDSIDIEMRVYEGQQATIKNVTVSGNTKTHDHVILREVRTLPGQKFSRSDLIRSQRELSQLGYFDPEQLNIVPVPNPADGTVDINYHVVEKPSDQIELSGGWGGWFGPVGTVGLVFNNFSMRNITNFKTWNPLPSGDGQRLALRVQASGRQFQTYSLSFTEPWLGGKRPQSLNISLSKSRMNTIDPETRRATGFLDVSSATIGLGKRLTWPDDFFTLNNSITLLQYRLSNYQSAQLGFSDGVANNFTFTTTIARNSVNDFTFPTSGSNISLQVAVTPPYSLFRNINYHDESILPEDRYRWVEYHKWIMDNSWFTTLIPGQKRNLVLNMRAHFGFIGGYSRSAGIAPFERFVMGGDGLSGFNFLLGSDIIGLRGYPNNQVLPELPDGPVPRDAGGTMFAKYVAELRYPINLSPAFSLFGVGFLEAGNTWNNFNNFNPFNVYRAAGVGARIFMPAFGMIGLDWGYRLDNLPGQDRTTDRSQVTFTIGQQIR